MLSLLLLPALLAPARAVEPAVPPVPVAAPLQVLPLTERLNLWAPFPVNATTG